MKTIINTIYGWSGIYKGADRTSAWCIKALRSDDNKKGEYILRLDEIKSCVSNGVSRTPEAFAQMLRIPF